MKYTKLILFLSIVSISCNRTEKANNSVSISIRNKELTYYFNSDSTEIYSENKVFPNSESRRLSTNSLSINIKNDTQKKYLFLVNDFELTGTNCFELNIYENGIKNSVTKSFVNRGDHGVVENTKFFTCLEFKSSRDVSKVNFLRSTKFKNTHKYEVLNFLNNRYVISPNENIEFLYSIKIPFLVEDNIEGLFDPKYFKFKPNKTYEFSVTYKIDKEIEKDLPNEILKNLGANNIEIFYGSIESNRIPIRNVFDGIHKK